MSRLTPFAFPWGRVAAATACLLVVVGVIPFVDAHFGPGGILAAAAFILVAACALALFRRLNRRPALHSAPVPQPRADAGLLTLALRETSESAGGWFWEANVDLRIIHVHRRLAQGLGCTPEALIGRRIEDLFPDHTGAGWHRFNLAMQTRQPVDCVVELPLFGRSTWWQITAAPAHDGAGACTGYRGIAFDLTGERESRQRLSAQKSAGLRESARKSLLLNSMGQDVRDSLSTIIGYADHLLSPKGLEAGGGAWRQHVHTISESALQLQGLVDEVLELVRFDDGQQRILEQEGDAAEIAEIALKMCREGAEQRDVTVIASLLDGIELRCDVTRIKKALKHLAMHAIAAAAPGSSLQLVVEQEETGGLAFAIHMTPSGPVAPPVSHREPLNPGGLGVPIARQIALLHGGEITADHSDNSATVLRLHLPADRVRWPRAGQSKLTRAA